MTIIIKYTSYKLYFENIFFYFDFFIISFVFKIHISSYIKILSPYRKFNYSKNIKNFYISAFYYTI